LPDEALAHLVEGWLARAHHQKVQRSTPLGTALNADVQSWIQTWNDNPKPYVWTKTAEDILDSIARYCTRINDSRH
jgi:hypothetical protein